MGGAVVLRVRAVKDHVCGAVRHSVVSALVANTYNCPAPKTPPPPTPSDSPIPSTISTNPRALLERIHSGNASAQAGLNLAQLLHPFHSSSTTPSPLIQPYVRAMFAGRQKFEALQTAAIVRAEEEGLNETRRCASVPLDWSMLNLH